MKYTMACSTWVKEEDEIILEILRNADVIPTVDEMVEMTGLRRWRIEHTLRMWRKQIAMAASRKRMTDCDGLLEEVLGENWREELTKSGPEESDEEIELSGIVWGEDC